MTLLSNLKKNCVFFSNFLAFTHYLNFNIKMRKQFENKYFVLFTTHSYQFGKFGIFGTALIKVVVDCRKFTNIRSVEFQKWAFFDNHIGHFWKGGPVSNPTLKILQEIL